jgi:hypothetical protein
MESNYKTEVIKLWSALPGGAVGPLGGGELIV